MLEQWQLGYAYFLNQVAANDSKLYTAQGSSRQPSIRMEGCQDKAYELELRINHHFNTRLFLRPSDFHCFLNILQSILMCNDPLYIDV